MDICKKYLKVYICILENLYYHLMISFRISFDYWISYISLINPEPSFLLIVKPGNVENTMPSVVWNHYKNVSLVCLFAVLTAILLVEATELSSCLLIGQVEDWKVFKAVIGSISF